MTHTLIHTLPPTHLSSHPTLVPHSRTYVRRYMKDSDVYCGAGDVAVGERDVGADDDDVHERRLIAMAMVMIIGFHDV